MPPPHVLHLGARLRRRVGTRRVRRQVWEGVVGPPEATPAPHIRHAVLSLNRRRRHDGLTPPPATSSSTTRPRVYSGDNNSILPVCPALGTGAEHGPTRHFRRRFATGGGHGRSVVTGAGAAELTTPPPPPAAAASAARHTSPPRRRTPPRLSTLFCRQSAGLSNASRFKNLPYRLAYVRIGFTCFNLVLIFAM